MSDADRAMMAMHLSEAQVAVELQTPEMTLNVGPQHPSTHGVLRVVLKIDGERIVDLDPVLGYLHRGVEKICEHGDWHHAISNTDPLEYAASMFSESLPVLAAEHLLELLFCHVLISRCKLGEVSSSK